MQKSYFFQINHKAIEIKAIADGSFQTQEKTTEKKKKKK